MIISNSSSIEEDSPFYKINQSFCSKFEKFIIEHNGHTNGKYNAWSYLVYGKITEPNEWVLEYKKSTFTSDNSLFSLKNQNLFVSAIWKTTTTNSNDFLIRKRKLMDSALKVFNANISHLEHHKNYILIAKKNTKVIQQFIKTIHPLLISNEVYQISQMNKELKIELRTDKLYFDIFNRLNDLNL